jgi:hypothetical protein
MGAAAPMLIAVSACLLGAVLYYRRKYRKEEDLEIPIGSTQIFVKTVRP